MNSNNIINIKDAKKVFIKQSYEDNWEYYNELLKHSSLTRWDYFIITASNEKQAEAYRMQLKTRMEQNKLPKGTKYIVISDIEGKRIGSGGATLSLLRHIYELENCDINKFSKLRILVIHSGGDSKRVPQYSAIGKLFSHVPRELPDGRMSSLFDEMFIAFSGLPARMSSGLVVSAGDELILFNHIQADLMRDGAVGFSVKVPVEIGTQHGVYCVGDKDIVKKFLHKASIEKLYAKGAVNKFNYVDLDVGTIWMSGTLMVKLLSLIINNEYLIDENKFSLFVNDRVRLNFYGDFLFPLTSEAKLDEYLKEPAEGEWCTELDICRRKIWDSLNGNPLYIQRLSPSERIHFGTTKELLNIMTSDIEKYDYLHWQYCTTSLGTVNKSNIINSEIESGASIGKGCYIEDSYICSKATVEDGCIISNVNLKSKMLIKKGTVLHLLPLYEEKNRKYVARIYGVNDNPKDVLNNGITFLGFPISGWMKNNNINIEDLWDTENSLWEAKLYPVCDTEEEAINWAIKLQDSIDNKFDDKVLTEWKCMKRINLRESYQLADVPAILKRFNLLEDRIQSRRFIDAIKKGKWVEEVLLLLGKNKTALRRMKIIYQIAENVRKSDPILAMRIYRSLAEASLKLNINNGEICFDNLENLSFNIINKAICDSYSVNLQFQNINYKQIAIKNKCVEVEMPVRVHIGGAWSDAIPYCIEHGGTMLNMAILLNGKRPVKVKVEKLDSKIIKLESIDQRTVKIFDNINELINYNDPTDPFALHKAALVVAGLLPYDVGGNVNIDLKDIINNIGGGIHLTTCVDVPKGSGLGTSSILAAAVLQALQKFIGVKYDEQKIISQVLCLEQLITTGGGWQDQVGGLIPGIKLVKSQPGIPQNIIYEKVNLSKDTMYLFEKRLVLIYTGQRRLAKSILRNVMGRYIINDPKICSLLEETQRIALLMKFELEKGKIDNYAQLMNKNWQCIKELDPGSTNRCIDQIIDVCSPYLSGAMVTGAGGGGFIVGILKKAEMRDELNTRLQDIFQDTQVRLRECSILE